MFYFCSVNSEYSGPPSTIKIPQAKQKPSTSGLPKPKAFQKKPAGKSKKQKEKQKKIEMEMERENQLLKKRELERQREREKEKVEENIPEAVQKGRLNLRKALGNVIRRKDVEPEVKKNDRDSEEEKVKTIQENTKKAIQETRRLLPKLILAKNNAKVKVPIVPRPPILPQQQGRVSRKSSPPKSNDDSSNDASMKHVILPKEEPEPEITTQIDFMKVLGLYPSGQVIDLKRIGRKRRTCRTMEKPDFHYGNFDLNEVCFTFNPFKCKILIKCFRYRSRKTTRK